MALIADRGSRGGSHLPAHARTAGNDIPASARSCWETGPPWRISDSPDRFFDILAWTRFPRRSCASRHLPCSSGRPGFGIQSAGLPGHTAAGYSRGLGTDSRRDWQPLPALSVRQCRCSGRRSTSALMRTVGGVRYKGARWSKYRVWCLQRIAWAFRGSGYR